VPPNYNTYCCLVYFINASEDYIKIRGFIRPCNDNQIYSIQSSSADRDLYLADLNLRLLWTPNGIGRLLKGVIE